MIISPFVKTINHQFKYKNLLINNYEYPDFTLLTYNTHALLSCGPYTVYLGNFISKKMNKKAIYIGGPLNIFFCIYGERYMTSKFFLNMMNNDYRSI